MASDKFAQTVAKLTFRRHCVCTVVCSGFDSNPTSARRRRAALQKDDYKKRQAINATAARQITAVEGVPIETRPSLCI